MLKIIKKTTPVKLDANSARAFQSQLQGRFNSLLAGVRLEYARRLGLEDGDLLPPPTNEAGVVQLGEIFLTQPGTVCYVRYQGQEEVLEASAISNSKEANLEEFFREVSACLANAGIKSKGWSEPNGDSTMPEDAEPASTHVSEKELEAARELMKPESRTLLEQLASQESILVREIDTTGVRDLFRQLQHFEDLELIRKDYAVIDQKTGQQILRVPSRASLEEASQKFFIGGTAISNDNVDEVISCTPFCRHLLANDMWLLLLLLGTLSNLDLGPDSVFVCRSEAAPSRVYLQTSQQKFLLVLSNRRLSLDDAYLIGAQVAAYDLKDIIVVCTDRTSTLMRHHLRQANPKATFAFVDALSDLDSQLRSILLERQRSYLREILDPLAALTPVRVQDLIVRKMVPSAARDQAAEAAQDSVEDAAPASFEAAPEDSGEEEEESSPARLIADSFEAPAPDILPAFDTDRERAAAPTAGSAPMGIQIEMPKLSDEDVPEAEERFPSPELAVPDMPSISEAPRTEEEPERRPAAHAAAGMGAQVPSPAPQPSPSPAAATIPLSTLDLVPDLPEAEELIPDLPTATEPAVRSEI
jgi:hypothetical protein